MSDKKAFTLIELLVVIAIIAILAAILFPVFVNAKESARKSQCLSSEKQLAAAILAYTGDWNETLPEAYTNDIKRPIWPYAVHPYVHNDKITDCPSGGSRGVGRLLWRTDYGMNVRLGTCNNIMQRFVVKLGEIRHSSKTMMLMDASWHATYPKIPEYEGGWGVAYVGDKDWHFNPLDFISPGVVHARHGRGVNVAFVDGHVGWYKEEVVLKTKSMWDIK